MAWKQERFDESCRKFRNLFPDFQSFDSPGKGYVERERGYKDDLLALFDDQVRRLVPGDPSDFFRAYAQILGEPLRSTGEPQNFIFRNCVGAMQEFSDTDSSEFGQILRPVVESNGDPESIDTYSKAASQFRQSHPTFESSSSPAALRDIVSLLLMLHDPKEFMFDPITYWNRSANLLLDEPLLKMGSHITRDGFMRCQDFAKRVFSALRAANFRPTDMVDVQCFLFRAGSPTWNQRAFESSIAEFKRHYQGFENFSNCGDEYLRLQREFKKEILKSYRQTVKPLIEKNPVEFLDAYARIVNSEIKSHRPAGAEGWRVLTNEVPSEKKDKFGSMLQSLINAKASKSKTPEWDSILARYCENSKQLLEGLDLNVDLLEMQEKLHESATLLLSLRWPNSYVHATRNVWNVAGEMFLERELIESSEVITPEILGDIWRLTARIRDELNAAGLSPKRSSDKFDIQSFLWFTYDQFKSAKDSDSPKSANIDRSASIISQQLDLATIIQAIRSEGMRIDEATVRQYHFSMRTRGFIVLAGPSGVGKTWLTRLYANALKAEYLLAPVAPNWSTNEDLLGFFNPVDGNFHATAFLDFIDRAAESWDRLGADAPEFHLVLDEMNLARVEHYFSLFLSLMEMRREADVPETRLTGDRVVHVPSNLKFAGTVNMDETTHGFADKVFDRAQLIELSISSDAAREHINERIGETPAAEVLLDLWARMAPACPVGFRVLDDIADYLKLAEEEGVDWRVALDEQIVSKLLPKLRGLDPEVAEALRLIDTRVDGEFPRASAKCKSMLQRVQATDVVSFF